MHLIHRRPQKSSKTTDGYCFLSRHFMSYQCLHALVSHPHPTIEVQLNQWGSQGSHSACWGGRGSCGHPHHDGPLRYGGQTCSVAQVVAIAAEDDDDEAQRLPRRLGQRRVEDQRQEEQVLAAKFNRISGCRSKVGSFGVSNNQLFRALANEHSQLENSQPSCLASKTTPDR